MILVVWHYEHYTRPSRSGVHVLLSISASVRPRDCGDLYEAGQTTSGVFTIFPTNGSLGQAVRCDMDTEGGGWTVTILYSSGLFNWVF